MDALKHRPLDPATPAQTLGGTDIPSAHLCHPESCYPAALSRSMTASVCSELPHSAQWPHPACEGSRPGAERLLWDHSISCLPPSGLHSRNMGVLWWVEEAVSAPRAAVRCSMAWRLLSWENAAGRGGRQPPSPGAASLGTAGQRCAQTRQCFPTAKRCPGVSPLNGGFQPFPSIPSRLQPSQNPAFVRIF